MPIRFVAFRPTKGQYRSKPWVDIRPLLALAGIDFVPGQAGLQVVK